MIIRPHDLTSTRRFGNTKRSEEPPADLEIEALSAQHRDFIQMAVNKTAGLSGAMVLLLHLSTFGVDGLNTVKRLFEDSDMDGPKICEKFRAVAGAEAKPDNHDDVARFVRNMLHN